MDNIRKIIVTTGLESGHYERYEVGLKDWNPVEIAEFKDRFELTFRLSRKAINKARLLSWEVWFNG